MAQGHATDTGGSSAGGARGIKLIPHEYLRIMAVWSLIPSYAIAGAFLGYLADRAIGWFPYLTGAGLLLSLAFSVRDVMRLRDEF